MLRLLILFLFINQAFASDWDYFSIFKNINYHKEELSFAKYTEIFLKNAKNKKINKRQLNKLSKLCGVKHEKYFTNYNYNPFLQFYKCTK